ncbi:helix-turn-helix transcriptional regulator [Leifsonia sp. CL147]|uniref:helix-turn-helix transcriptional regulator n=1 Tax=unclassified Leifsonia TaxID=2663824 RepID=UPI000B7F301D|nr:helix-turn-helix transcriptional regulator [Leifsonia sp. CL147]
MSSSFTAEGDFHRALANLLASSRLDAHLSQGSLAAELGIDQAAVSRVESGHRRLTVGETFAWFEALGFTIDDTSDTLAELWRTHGGRPPGFWTEHNA